MTGGIKDRWRDLRAYASSDAEFEKLKKEAEYLANITTKTLSDCIDRVQNELARGTLKYTHPGASEST